MNKIKQLYLNVIVCLFFCQSIISSPLLEQIQISQPSFLSVASLENIQHIIYQYPKLSLILAVVISYLGCKKLFFPTHNKRIKTDAPSKAEIHHSADKANATLLFTPPHKKEPYCYNNLHSYEISPSGNFILARQLNEASLISALFSGFGAYSIMQNLLRCSIVHHILDIKTGTILLSLANAQQCTFSNNEKYLLVRETKTEGKFSKLQRLFTKAQPLGIKKDPSGIQYRVIDLATKKTIYTIDNVFSATFCDDDTLVIVDQNNIQHLKPEQSSTLFTKKTRFCPHKQECAASSPSPLLKFYFDGAQQTFCLDIEVPGKPLQTIEHVKTYTQHNNHVLISTDLEEHRNLEALKDSSLTSIIGLIQSIISILQKPKLETHLFSLVTSKMIDIFSYTNPVICCFKGKDIVFICSLDNNSLLYKELNLTNYATSEYQNGKAVTFSSNNLYTVIDDSDENCALRETNLFNILNDTTQGVQQGFQQMEINIEKGAREIHENVNTSAQKLLAHLNANFSKPDSINIPVIEPNNNHNEIPYNKYHFLCKTLSTCKESQTKYQELIQKGVHGLEWNIHIFDHAKFSTFTNRLDDYPLRPNGHICISHLIPKDMLYNQYQSLTNELNGVFDYMNNNSKAIISIFLTANDCSAEKIETEINDTVKNKKTNFLLTPQDLAKNDKTLDTITIAQMIESKKRLLLFCDKITSVTHPLPPKRNPCITYI